MKFKSKIYLSYDDVLSMVKQLEYDVSKMRPDIVVGIQRGGVVPALHLSHALDRPMEVVVWQTRDGIDTTMSDAVYEALDRGNVVLFVDDINDSGRTLQEIIQACNLKGDYNHLIKTAVLVEKTSSIHKADSKALRIDDERWIVFPWEKD
tara:strand:+ start:6376 stop:6825 length:450 start_codon:yes stop_codon:yes gene_type:complete